jgi:hypothetical protein
MSTDPNDPNNPSFDRRSPWTPLLVRLIVALIIATPFVAILLQAIGKIRQH